MITFVVLLGNRCRISSSNRRFQQVMPEEEVFDIYFRSPVGNEPAEELTCGELLKRIQQRDPGFKYTSNVAKFFGRTLKNKFVNRFAHRGLVYRVVEIK
ncbi:protein of unknown function [Bacteroides luti]|uniref:DUF3874 domain-containing protein n=1 Tax=Bacteroides luti TaxID=1297750 RepID=A0A1M4VE61_9BACE|nr:DUF3874 domain-containing protein [Bacteroides luti]SHE67291.1 protein of unknown function [Bacteroides luti]